jgi:hypothetical protein
MKSESFVPFPFGPTFRSTALERLNLARRPWGRNRRVKELTRDRAAIVPGDRRLAAASSELNEKQHHYPAILHLQPGDSRPQAGVEG